MRFEATVRSRCVVLFALALLCCFSHVTLADGTETLGPVAIADGTDIVGNGVGLVDGPETMAIEIPDGTTVEQVLLYWNGFHSTSDNAVDTIIVEVDGGGQMAITGTLIGGPTLFFGTSWSSTYRADITGLGLITAPGSYDVEVSPFGAGYDRANNGASILVVVDDPTRMTNLQLADGQDLAYRRFAEPLKTTVPQTFTFEPAAQDRFMTLSLIAGSVQGVASGDLPVRPNIVDVTVGGSRTRFEYPFNSNSGDEWDHVCNSPFVCPGVVSPKLDVTIPANETSVTIEAISAGFCSNDVMRACLLDSVCEGGGVCLLDAPNEPKPTSFAWIATALSIRVPSCGDGMLDPGEVCDDGNSIDDDECRNDCTIPRCGDGILDPTDGETCDPPGDPAGANDNLCDDDCTVCGDGVKDADEACDDGNSIDDDECRNDCTIPRCGDGILDPTDGETCDPPGDPAGANDNLCDDDCTVCGDGVKDADEACDDGNSIDDDECRNDCTIPRCGDGILDPTDGETCDPPGDPAGANDNLCDDDCTVCGDGVKDADEACDDGNSIDDDECRNDCTIPRCGDGILDPTDGETCDPPGDPAGANDNLCDDDCTVCGDGVKDADEACDDGNSIDDDECRNDCTIPRCGDGILDPTDGETCDPPGDPAGANDNLCDDDCTVCGDGVKDADEACDDGNSIDDDECRNDCTIPRCGDGILDPTDGETCDPPGDPAGANDNLCDDDCTVCGDGVKDADEACDDGNSIDDDECRNDCTIPRCGDGILDPTDGETCDPPGDPAGANDNLCDDDCTVCGDGVKDADEACDDGNSIDDDECRNDCTIPRCGDGILDPTDGETCDPPGDPAGANDNLCDDDCTVCGDGVKDADEACDDGNSTDDDECRNDCTIPRCGDGILDPTDGETCDPPGDPAGANDNLCDDDCTVCGDGVKDADEACDDGNSIDDDECRNDCTIPRCGDGILDPTDGETCDPPGDPAGANDNLCDDDCTVCGDGVKDADEACDDGNSIDDDECRNDCTIPRCGDGILDPTDGETCDPPGDPAGANDNLCDDDCTVCGDGVKDADEACDDGNSTDDDECRNDCTIPRCGDGILDPTDGETCDPPGDPAGANDNLCDDDCTVCGDGVKDADEACDDGNSTDDDECRNDCTIPRCGDGILDPTDGETCDPPGDPAGANDNLCDDDCTVCGDGVKDADEACDDGNSTDDDECRNDCTIPRCGDGILDPTDGETCDPPGDPAGANDNLCDDDCTVCGDGVKDADEACDDGNSTDDDECRNDCTIPRCGDGILDPTDGETCDPPGDPAGANDNLCDDDCTVCGDGVKDADEACDDGNSTDDDECRNDCTIPRCGDGILDPTDGETCDPPGDPAGANDNLCDDDCTVCGDGVKDADEACDDGNSTDDDECRNDCTIPRCGDGILDPTDGETCDPPGDPAGANDNPCDDDCTVCGDGNVDADEECDDGNDVNGDDCNNECMRRCEAQLDKQISCDGGQTYVDTGFGDNVASTCVGWDGDDEIKVRYVVDTEANGSLFNCQLIDSNGLVLGGSVDIGTLTGNLDEFVIWETSAIECSEQLEAAEPNTATLACECYEPGSGVTVMASDEANIECQAVALDVVKECGYQDPDTKESPVSITVSNPPNPRGASLTHCEVIDEVANFVSETFDLAPGESRDFNLTVTGLTAPTLNIAWVHCDIVGAGGKRIVADAYDRCRVCPDITLDKQVSCDGGSTFVDVGENDGGAVETCMGREGGDDDIVVRYVANGMIDGLHSGCSLVDSNGELPLGDPQPMFGFPGAVFETYPKDCTKELEAGEPNTATLTCECYEPGSGLFVSDDDEANIECASPECGDGILDEEDGETCDPPGDPAGASGNDCREDCTVCGDGVLDSVETCDDGNNVDDDGCRNDCTFCGDGVLDPTEECDDGNNDAGDGCSPDCTVEELCDLAVIKTCIVPEIGDGDDDDDDDSDCEGKVVSMKLQYTGEGCDATNNDQEGRAGCWGGANSAEPVSIKVADERGSKVYADVDNVFLGDVVEATAANAGENEFTSQTSAWIDHGLEDVTFHTSCSKPLAVGDQFGSLLLVELTTTDGGTVTLPPAMDPMGDPDMETSECTIPATPPEPHCDGKVQSLGLRYLGGDCDASNNDQGDKAECYGAATVDPVRIRCFKDGDSYLDTVDTTVSLGDVVTATAANAGKTDFGSETLCEIYDDGGSWLQDLRFHTSCSQPLNLGDRFGALEVFSLDTSGGGMVSLATEVLYRYRITNNSAVPAENVAVLDSELGELAGSPIAMIATDETVLLEATALISETTTNTVTVTASLVTGEVCEAVEDTATVTVEEPPVLQECTSKIDAMLLQYIGPDIAGPVTVEVLPRSQSDAVVYEFPDGLAGGTVVSSDAQNGYTVDPGVQGQDDAGSKTSVFINGDEEVHHTSCSTPYVSGLPAPLDSPKGDPSPNWFVIDFTQK